ncbi:MAG: flagellar biosynthetic protein FliO [Rickettsiales bacterium]|nr:flagellar biosynthetic protein FliO [Rickettsiales bacterium]
MDEVDIIRFTLAFVLVICLIALLGVILRICKKSQMSRPGKRLHIVEVQSIDSRRKLVLIRRDQVEHVMLLADGREMLIESNIPMANAEKASA